MWRDRPTLLLALLLAAAGLILASPSFGHPFFWDDLHWFRDYSFAELSGTWLGTNDPDELEIPGFRPLHATTNWALWELLGEHPGAYRVVAVIALAAGHALIAAAAVRLGVPLAVAFAAVVLVTLATNLTYLAVWPSAAYHAIQVATFGGALWAAVHGLTGGGPARLVVALALWAVTIMIAELGLVLLGVLVGTAVLAGSGGIGRLAEQVGAPSYPGLWRAVRGRLSAAWASRRTRAFAAGAIAIAALDTAARFAFVSDATPVGLSLDNLRRTLVLATSLAGEQSWLGTLAYPGLAAVALAVVLAAPLMTRREAATLPWLAAMSALAAMATSAAFGLQIVRSDISNFPLLFYCLFLSATALLVHRMLPPRARLAGTVLATAAVAVSTVTAVAETVRLQEAFGRWSVQRLAYDYGFLYSDERTATVPAQRRAAVAADLRRVGLPDGRVPDADVPGYLYCRAVREPSSTARVPARFAFGPDVRDDFARCGER